MKTINRREEKENQWIALIKQALDQGVDIRANYHFKYDNKNLGGFLYRVKNKNNTRIIEKLEKIGFDIHSIPTKEGIYKEKREKWLALLKEAIDAKEPIQLNHRYKYKGKNLGTFLVEAKDKREVRKQVRALGFNFSNFIRKPKLYAKRFIKDLQRAKPKDKPKFITRFYSYVLPKKHHLSDKTIAEINRLWKEKFNDRRVWRRPMIEEQRIVLWKNFRYDIEKNPAQKWMQSRRIMGDLFDFAYRRKRKPNLMFKIKDYFSKEEIEELKSEGFLNK